MTRKDLQDLSRLRMKEAQYLYKSKSYSGAYYLAGYSIELALKSCIARKMQRYVFPELSLAKDSYSHDVVKLVKVARLHNHLHAAIRGNAVFKANWLVVTRWDEGSRYERISVSRAKELIESINDKTNGVLQWIQGFW